MAFADSSPCSFYFSCQRIAAFECQRCKRNDEFPTPAVKSQPFITGVVHEMCRLESRSFSFAVQIQLEVAAFQYQASILTRSALRLYLPLQSKPALSRGLSRIFRGTFAKHHPRFRAESHRLTPTDTHTQAWSTNRPSRVSNCSLTRLYQRNINKVF